MKIPREVSSINRSNLTELLGGLKFLCRHENWDNKHPDIQIVPNLGENGFTAMITTDVEPDEWGWHENGSPERFDGYQSYEEAQDAIDMRFLDAMKNHEGTMGTVGPYPIWDGEAMEDYDE